jgi:type IV secretory pathway VirB10-like protein
MARDPQAPAPRDAAAIVLGYANFSSGSFDPAVWRAISQLYADREPADPLGAVAEQPDTPAGVAAALVLSAAALVAGVVAWPFIQPALRQANRPTKKRAVAIAAARPEPPRAAAAAPAVAERTEKPERPAATAPAPPPLPSPEPQPPAPTPPVPPPPPVAVGDDAKPAMREGEREPAPDKHNDKDAAQAAGAVDRGIAAAAAALRRHDHPAAEQALEVAGDAADGDPDLETRVNRWRLLVAYAGELDGHLERAVASANEGREYTIGDRTISIIDVARAAAGGLPCARGEGWMRPNPSRRGR